MTNFYIFRDIRGLWHALMLAFCVYLGKAQSPSPFYPINFIDPFPPTPATILTNTFAQDPDSVFFDKRLNDTVLLGGISFPMPDSITNGLKAISVEFWMQRRTNEFALPGGNLIRGPGFRIVGGGNFGQFGALFGIFYQFTDDGKYIGFQQLPYIFDRAPDNLWHYYVFTYDTRQFAVYIDGELHATGWSDNTTDKIGPMEDGPKNEATELTSVTNLTISGNYTGAETEFFPFARVANLRASSVALTAREVRQNFEKRRVYSNVLFASPTGTGIGTLESPLSLAAALAQSGPLTRITLLPGTYPSDQFRVTAGGRSPFEHCLITGPEGMEPAVIQGSSAVIDGAEHLQVRNLTFVGNQGLTVTNAFKVEIDCCRFAGVSDGITIRNSERVAVQNSIFSISEKGAVLLNSPESRLLNNTFVGGSVAAQFNEGSPGVTFLNNLLSGQSDACVEMMGDSLRRYRGDANLYHPATAAAALKLHVSGRIDTYFPIAVTNRILSAVWYTNDTIDVPDPGKQRTGYAAESRSMSFPPVFKNAAAGLYEIKPVHGTSINEGVTQPWQSVVTAPLYDITGLFRPVNKTIDVGAYETTPLYFAELILETNKTVSAGVFLTNGTLIRTLFSGTKLPPGKHRAWWNGLDDFQSIAPPGREYQIRFLTHNVVYKWEGAVGNTSTNPNYGASIHANFLPLHSMVIIGTNAYYSPGYNEGRPRLRHFTTDNPRQVKTNFGGSEDPSIPALQDLDSDGERIYSLNARSCYIYANSNLNVFPPTTFENGQTLITAGGFPTDPLLSYNNGHVAVQRSGNALIVSRLNLDEVSFYHKRSGASNFSLTIPAPGDMAVDSTDGVWIISGKSELRYYTNLNEAPTLAKTIPAGADFTNVLAIAVSPIDDSIVIADGSTHQLRSFSKDGETLWTYGQPGGYANGPRVTYDKFGFYFTDGYFSARAYIAFQPDGSFWVGDTVTSRNILFDTNRNYVTHFEYIPHFYRATVDLNDPTRLFAEYTEYAIDYSKPLDEGWKMTNFWGFGLPQDAYDYPVSEGFNQVLTMTNGRTYGLTVAFPGFHLRVVELEEQRLRYTTYSNLHGQETQMEPDGSLNVARFPIEWFDKQRVFESIMTFTKRPLVGFSTNNDPLWGDAVTLGSAPVNRFWQRSSPFGRLPRTTSSGKVVNFNSFRENGWHLGAIQQGETNWLWLVSHSLGGLDGLGTFETWAEYGGSAMMTSGRQIYYGYFGEFYKGLAQANQYMHFYDNGLFVGQFGTPNTYNTVINAPGAAGNILSPVLVELGDKAYIYNNDESSRGINRWISLNLDSIQEHIVPIQKTNVTLLAPEVESVSLGTVTESTVTFNPRAGYAYVVEYNDQSPESTEWVRLPPANVLGLLVDLHTTPERFYRVREISISDLEVGFGTVAATKSFLINVADTNDFTYSVEFSESLEADSWATLPGYEDIQGTTELTNNISPRYFRIKATVK
ncbi:MAG: right-handed parallel beta-helix repeat-containing protein [Verrucomicrobiota bacterium]|nr:right-handed parallel beta-helix repeat-containing protein [Verrucomicrobiota bacterium]